jgi:hypothetical protein
VLAHSAVELGIQLVDLLVPAIEIELDGRKLVAELVEALIRAKSAYWT